MAGQSEAKAHCKTTAPGAPQARCGFWSALWQRSGRPCAEVSRGELEAALLHEVAEISRFA